MAHHNKLPAAGVNPALLPTAAQKASLDNTPGLGGTTAFVSVGAGLASLLPDQVAALSQNTALSSTNQVAGRADLLSMATGTGLSVPAPKWLTGRTDLNSTTHKAIALIFPTSGPTTISLGTINPTTGEITFAASGGSYDVAAYLFLATSVGNITA